MPYNASGTRSLAGYCARRSWNAARAPRHGRRRELAAPRLQVGPQLLQFLLALPSQFLHRDELLAEGMHREREVALEARDVRGEAHEERVHAAQRVRDGADVARHPLHLRAVRRVGARRLRAQPGEVALELGLQEPHVVARGEARAGHEGDGRRERPARQAARATTHRGARRLSPPAMISNSSRRFWAHASSFSPWTAGRSSPKLTTSMRDSVMPRDTR